MREGEYQFQEFCNDVLIEADSTAVLQAEAFFQLYAEAAIENGDIENLEYCPVLYEGNRKYRIDGYHYNPDQQELVLGICDLRATGQLEALTASDAESMFARAKRFFEKSLDPEFIRSLEDSSPSFEAGYLIHTNAGKIKRVRTVIFSNARLAIRKKLVTVSEVNGRRFSNSILDFERYASIINSRTGSDPIEIDFTANGLMPLQCLEASASTKDYASYLVVVPGEILAQIYGLYGARLLEANVRTFLQARTNVNKGIIQTLEKEPENFFAYNNGLTATASDVEVFHSKAGTFIKGAKNLQIVNGGQTTASILYAQDIRKVDLGEVFVQMKLSRVDSNIANELTPKISRYANTQNRVSAADFFSSHPFHIHMEKLSRRITAPPAEGSLAATKWFYERARGQYRDEQAYMTASKKKAFQTEYPRDQMLVKTDLAKFEMSFMQKPHIVSLGAQKCIIEFAKYIDNKWKPDAREFGEGYFRDAMARARIFRWVDKHIGSSDWYKEDRGYKAQIVTYTIASLVHMIENNEASVDFSKVWSRQDLPTTLQDFLTDLAPQIAAILKDPPEQVRNVTEYCKRQFCWARIQDEMSHPVLERLADCLISAEEMKEKHSASKKTQIIDSGIDNQTYVIELAGEWKKIMHYGQQHRLLSPKEMGVLDIASRIPKRIPTEKQCQVAIQALEKLVGHGYELKGLG